MRTSRTEWLIKDCEWLSAEEKEIVLFGLMQGRSLINSIAVTILLGLLMGLLWESVLFVICFLPLRRYAGGFHAKTREGCLFFSVTIVVAAFFVIKYLRCENWIIAAVSVICLAILWKIAPVGNEKRLLNKEEKACFGKKTKIIAGTEMLVVFAALFFGGTRCAVVVMSVFATEVLCAVLGYMKLQRFKNKRE